MGRGKDLTALRVQGGQVVGKGVVAWKERLK